ncbi:MAG: ABC transporter permease [Bacteroidetes bacterium]|nr:MAG: ABC transporter permease [Bacteroidota bacterium]
MNFLFAWRYFKAKKSTNAINIIAWVSVAAIIIGTASLIIVLSVFNGLESLVKSLYADFYTDLKVLPKNGKFITLTPSQILQLSQIDGVRGYSLVVEEKALLQAGSLQPVVLKGVDTNFKHISGVPNKLVKGTFDLGTVDHPGAVLGAGIENALGIETDKNLLPLSAYMFKKNETRGPADPMQSMSNASLISTGTFVIQQDFDNRYAFTNIDFMKQMLGLGIYEFTGVEIALKDPSQTDLIKSKIQSVLGNGFLVQSRYEQNQGLYSVMRVEKWVIYCVLTMILIVACFNMVGALTMLVLEKQKDIQVLKAMGANNNYVQRIFLSEGLLLALVGGVIGILLAVAICWLQVRYHLVPLQGESFLISYYPVKLVPTDFLLVLSTILVVALLASWLPSRKAANQPIELRS